MLPNLPDNREKLSSLAFNGAGDWIAVGSAKLGQLLVWEWRRCGAWLLPLQPRVGGGMFRAVG